MITPEKDNVDRIIATLGLKEMSQSTLIRKLCALSQQNPTRKAVFEFDKLVRSIYTLDYIRDPQLQRDVHRSQIVSKPIISCARPSHKSAARSS